jgi:hypothetical protein
MFLANPLARAARVRSAFHSTEQVTNVNPPALAADHFLKVRALQLMVCVWVVVVTVA